MKRVRKIIFSREERLFLFLKEDLSGTNSTLSKFLRELLSAIYYLKIVPIIILTSK